MTANTNTQTIERLFDAGYDIDTLRWYEGFEDWYQARLEEASAPADLEEEAPKTTGQKIKETLLAMIAGALITLLIATAPAEAMPRKFRNRPTATVAGITYLSAPRDCDKGGMPVAIVTAVPRGARNLTIPATVRINGRNHKVTTIWDGTLSRARGLKAVTIRARLDVAEDPTLFFRDGRRVKIRATDSSTYRWLRRAGNANVTR